MDATQTNAITNALHACFLFFYFLGALLHFLKKDFNFTVNVVLFFLTISCLKLLGIYVHYYLSPEVIPPGWIAISLMTFLLNYFLVTSLPMSDGVKAITLIFSNFCVFLFLTHQGNFLFIALPVVLIYTIALFYSTALLRSGFVMVIISNLFWIAARQLGNFWYGGEIPIGYRYDNDIYHILLIIATFMVYKGFAYRSQKT